MEDFQLRRRRFLRSTCACACIPLIGCDHDEDDDHTPDSTSHDSDLDLTSYSNPCYATYQNINQGLFVQQASLYARSIISEASRIGGVTNPYNGSYEVLYMNNASYAPDIIKYDPYWLISFINMTGALEAGDSVIFHEVGHMWANKKGISNRIGYGTLERNWAHEYQADSFSGYIIKQLNGSALPSVSIYQTVMSGWGLSHPPGNLRAEVFYNSWLQNNVTYYADSSPDISLLARKKDISESLKNIEKLMKIRDRIIDLGMNPYSSESDIYFNL